MAGVRGDGPIDGHAWREADAVGGVALDPAGEPAADSALPDDLRYLAERERRQGLMLKQLFAEQEHQLRQKYADWIIWLLGAQFVIADLVFVAFAWAGQGWDLAPGVVEVWLAATVVQVVGVVAIVTRHLFPGREGVEVNA
jgi:glutathione S-transferase